METNLENYKTERDVLVTEIKSGKLSCLEAQSRCNELWKLIPSNIDLNDVMLNSLMKEKYGNSPDWYTTELL